MLKLPWVDHPQAAPIHEQINLCVRFRGLMTLVGLPGTGKSRLLRQLLDAGPRAFEPDQAILVELGKVPPKRVDSEGIASASALQLFSKLNSQLAQAPYAANQSQVAQNARQPTRKRESLLAMTRQSVELMNARQLRLVAIDNASVMDTLSLEWLLLLRKECVQPFALLLCARTAGKQASDQPFEKLFSNLPEAKASRTHGAVVQAMTEAESRAIMAKLLDQMEVDLDVEVRARSKELTTKWWRWTRGNWYQIERVSKLLLEKFLLDAQTMPYRLDWETVRWVEARLFQLKGLGIAPKEQREKENSNSS